MIEYTEVSRTYPDGTVALNDVSLTVNSGDIHILLGPSGCGKTTLLRMVNRMTDPSSGTVSIDGVDVATTNPVTLRRSIGYVLQHAGLLPHQRVIDNIATVPRLNGMPKQQAHARATAMLELVGLDPSVARRYPAQLSGGQQQRVGVARALAGEPSILLMDEPFGAVDPLIRRELQNQLLHLQRTLHCTILFVTHDIDEALVLGDQITLLANQGRIIASGTGAELVASTNEEVRAFLGLDRGDRVFHTTAEGLVLDAHHRVVGKLES